MPHGHCYLWRPDILWLNVLSDAGIALAYFSIPILLYYFLKKRPDVPFRPVLYIFSIFILACGITHLLGIWTVWHGDYGIHGVAKMVTALVSVATATMLYPVIPQLLALRSPLELEVANQALAHEVLERKQAEDQFRTFLESTPDATLIINTDGVIDYVNHQASVLFEYSQKDLTGMQIEALILDQFNERLTNYRKNNFKSSTSRSMGSGLERRGITKNGKEYPVEISLGQVRATNRMLVSASIRDISERKKIETQVKQLQSDLSHVARLSTMGEMASGLAHELNQPLTAIAQYCDASISTSSFIKL